MPHRKRQPLPTSLTNLAPNPDERRYPSRRQKAEHTMGDDVSEIDRRAPAEGSNRNAGVGNEAGSPDSSRPGPASAPGAADRGGAGGGSEPTSASSPTRLNALPIAALVCGIVGIVAAVLIALIGVIVGVVAVVLGIVARRRHQLVGLATGGIITGAIAVVVGVVNGIIGAMLVTGRL